MAGAEGEEVALSAATEVRQIGAQAALFLAAERDDAALARAALAAGGDPLQYRAEAVGDAPWFDAARLGASRVLAVMVGAGVGVDTYDDAYGEHTALHHASYRGRVEALAVLLSCGADPHLPDVDGLRPGENALADLNDGDDWPARYVKTVALMRAARGEA